MKYGNSSTENSRTRAIPSSGLATEAKVEPSGSAASVWMNTLSGLSGTGAWTVDQSASSRAAASSRGATRMLGMTISALSDSSGQPTLQWYMNIMG